MSGEVEILEKIDHLLTQLVDNASVLQRLSEKVISEEEVLPLQKKQEELIKQLGQLDADYHIQMMKTSKDPQPLQEKILQKLNIFQELNLAFIQNISDSQGLIHFENHKFKMKDKE